MSNGKEKEVWSLRQSPCDRRLRRLKTRALLISQPDNNLGRGARSLPEGRRRAARERERARDQALGRGPLAEPSAGAPIGAGPEQAEAT